MKPAPRVLTEPWLITEPGMQLVLGVWSRSELYPEVVASAREKWKAGDLEADKKGAAGVLNIVGAVAVIGVQGPLFRHASLFTDLSSATSYDALWKALEVAMATEQVKSILLKVNSPGGEADGCGELADYIAKCNAVKPVTAYVEQLCASAAYWLSSQASRIVAFRAAEIGSIGVRITLTDDTGAQKAAGEKRIEIVNRKSPDKRSSPIDDDVIERVQQRADDLADVFIDAVATGRKTTAADVAANFGQGDVLIAAKALEAGMIDGVADFNETLASMTSTKTSNPARGASRSQITMTTTPEQIAASAPVAAAAEPWKCSKCNEEMGPGARSYCAHCFGDEDGDEDEPDGDEARSFGGFALEALGVKSFGEARGKLAAAVESHEAIDALRAQLSALESEGRRRDLKAALTAAVTGGRLSLGAIQKSIGAFVLRGDSRKAWGDAMGKIETVSRESVIEAAASVAITADDLDAIRAYVDASAPATAPTATEPPRDADAESAEMAAQLAEIDRAAEQARNLYRRQTAASK